MVAKGMGSKGSKLERSETISVRLDPKLRYLVDLAARKQRRSMSSFVEWACEVAMEHVNITENAESSTSFREVAETLWDVDESDRFAKLAFDYPELLTHSEQVLWKLIRGNSAMWKGAWNESENLYKWTLTRPFFHWRRLREHWDKFRQVAAGEASEDTLPRWFDYEKKPNPATPTTPTTKATDDDDIPF